MIFPPECAVTLPAPLHDNAQLFLFSGWPAMPFEWVTEFKKLASRSVRQSLWADFELMSELEQGAPLGTYTAKSQRVARSSGVVCSSDATSAGSIEGAAVSQGWLGLRWRAEPEGLFLALEVHAPFSAGWGEALNTMCIETLNVACLRQYEKLALSLIDCVAQIELSQGFVLEFQGEWTDSTHILRKKLIQTTVSRWAGLVAHARSDDELLQLKAA